MQLYQLKTKTYVKLQWALNPLEGKSQWGLMAAAECLICIVSIESGPAELRTYTFY